MSSYDSPISCLGFACNTSACYDTFMNQNVIGCGQDVNFCELRRQADMNYLVSCSTNCSFMLCVNQTQTGCAANCCNTTGCLNVTLFSMMSPTVSHCCSQQQHNGLLLNHGHKYGRNLYSDARDLKLFDHRFSFLHGSLRLHSNHDSTHI
ncbi:hypothetical protein AAFF_G00077410 [Aldrovandia affinis]|uniref:Uncharacterized protein n=1 Tax=Aldrovandia affinis TaxID=143900 RepID=A0AAD7R3N7_9TELE|nr:hypothetical protein AAFF_G00077410 [Aldrovandia affinis]